MAYKHSMKLIQGIPDDLIYQDSANARVLSVDNAVTHKGVSRLWTGDTTLYNFFTPASGNRTSIRGITVCGTGAVGNLKIYRGNGTTLIYPFYFNATANNQPSPNMNVILDVDEPILVTLTGRGSNETFLGITVVEFNDADNSNDS